jgi:tetratricopeptide (TPR) repeat protein
MSRRCPGRLWWFNVVALLTLVAPRPALAAPPFPAYEHRERMPKTIGVVAFRNYAIAEDDLFRPSGTPLRDDAALGLAEAYAHQWLQQKEDVRLVSARALRDRIAQSRPHREGLLVAREWFNIGVDHYQELRTERAVENLERAVALYSEVFQDVVDPFSLAEVELYRALALAEQGQEELAHVALKRMILLDPTKRFPRGYHTSGTESALVAALVDFHLTGTPEMVLPTLERVEELLRLAELDGLLFGYLRRVGEARVLHVVLFEGGPARVTFRDQAELPETASDAGDGQEGLDRLLARWSACAIFRHAARPKGPEHARLLFDLGFAESFPLLHPTRSLFHQVGFAFGVSYHIARNLDLFGHLFVATTIADRDRDLLAASTAVRATFGLGFVFRSPRLRWFIHPGIQVAAMPRLSWTTNAYCKLYAGMPAEERSPLCRPGDISRVASPVLAGLDLTVGVDIFLSSEIFLGVKVGGAAYLVPFAATGDVNFPLLFQVGLGYAL